MTSEQIIAEVKTLVNKVYQGQISSEIAMQRAIKIVGEEGSAIFMKLLLEDPRARNGINANVK
jgi:hypothetical protein